MKKVILGLAILLTASNLAAGVAYAAVCEGTNGARACGSGCAVQADGTCGCSGNCTTDELNWVAGAKKPAMAEMMVYDY
jgi:hypothetical protein